MKYTLEFLPKIKPHFQLTILLVTILLPVNHLLEPIVFIKSSCTN